jgi:hypothetical protein
VFPACVAQRRISQAVPQGTKMNALQRKHMDQHSAAVVIQSKVRGKQTRTVLRTEKLELATQLLQEVAVMDDGAHEVASPGDLKKAGWTIQHDTAASSDEGTTSMYAQIDRDRLCCDLLNTSVAAALVGGFALSNMVLRSEETLDYIIYTLSCLAVHACTCSCLTTVLLYRVAVRMREEVVPIWGSKKINQWLIKLPLLKFGMGCVSYLASVVLRSFADLETTRAFQIICLVIGIMSMSTVFLTVAVMHGPELLEALRPASKGALRRKQVAPHTS